MKTIIKEPRLWILFLIVSLISCQTEDAKPFLSGSYFPLENNRQWSYRRWLSFDQANPLELAWDTLQIRIQGDVVVGGKTYKEIVEDKGLFNKIVRVEGSKYYGRNHEFYGNDFSHEYIFLDTDKAVGESWIYIKDAGYSQTEYIVLAKNATANIHGVEHKNVIELQVNYYHQTADGSYELWVTAYHKYAEGVGEVYSFYPYPISLLYGDVSSFIMKD